MSVHPLRSLHQRVLHGYGLGLLRHRLPRLRDHPPLCELRTPLDRHPHLHRLLLHHRPCNRSLDRLAWHRLTWHRLTWLTWPWLTWHHALRQRVLHRLLRL